MTGKAPPWRGLLLWRPCARDLSGLGYQFETRARKGHN